VIDDSQQLIADRKATGRDSARQKAGIGPRPGSPARTTAPGVAKQRRAESTSDILTVERTAASAPAEREGWQKWYISGQRDRFASHPDRMAAAGVTGEEGCAPCPDGGIEEGDEGAKSPAYRE
jgi:hypothetical protein